MTKTPAIRMQPNRLPPLTLAQHSRYAQWRRTFAQHGKVSCLRKGQEPGVMCLSAILEDRTVRAWYGPDGNLLYRTVEHGLFGMAKPSGKPNSAITHN